MAIELYLHIPFCIKKCNYCDFLSGPGDIQVQRAYVEALKDEIKSSCYRSRKDPVTTVFIGGGTPSVLPTEWILELADTIRSSYVMEPQVEFTMECNPGTVTKEDVKAYYQAGINRLSFGLQSTDNEELKCLGRVHTWETFLESFWAAREAGYDNLNIDLMSALPGQTMESYEKGLRKLIELKPEHISAYSLIIEEGTPFYDLYGKEDEKRKRGERTSLLPDEETEALMYQMTRTLLSKEGYEAYEISNYARPGYACKHNLGYWTRKEYLGFGLGAASFVEGKRFTNSTSMEEYLRVLPPEKKHTEEEEISREAAKEEFLFLGLRLKQGISSKDYEKISGETSWGSLKDKIMELQEKGLLRMNLDRIALTEKGTLVANLVIRELVCN